MIIGYDVPYSILKNIPLITSLKHKESGIKLISKRNLAV